VQLAIPSIGYFSRNKRKKHLKAREFVGRKPITNKRTNNSIRSAERDSYKVYKESKETSQLNQSFQKNRKHGLKS
jgi:hypothetical protein